MTTTAKIILDSVNPENGSRLTTMQLVYPRFVHAEFMTHRMFSRNASSSRAIPVAKMIEQVFKDPAMPCHWGKNQPGMQAREEITDKTEAEQLWREAASDAAHTAEFMSQIGLHKQVVNRILEPFQWIHVVVTATEWDNFFKLRLHEDADPNIYELARVMKVAMDESTPVERHAHLPYVDGDYEIDPAARQVLNLKGLGMVSAGRCARVSYLNHDGTNPDYKKDLELAEKLAASGHASPFEHVAFSFAENSLCANLTGWASLRQEMAI
jgi:thymidylate synthase ThyX